MSSEHPTVTPNQANWVLSALLVGQQLTSVRVAGWWSLFFSDDLLVEAQEVYSVDAPSWEAALVSNHADILETEALGAIAATRAQWDVVVAVAVDQNGFLSLQFEQGSDLVFPAQIDIVDWCWRVAAPDGVGHSGPHVDDLVAWHFELFVSREAAARVAGDCVRVSLWLRGPTRSEAADLHDQFQDHLVRSGLHAKVEAKRYAVGRRVGRVLTATSADVDMAPGTYPVFDVTIAKAYEAAIPDRWPFRTPPEEDELREQVQIAVELRILREATSLGWDVVLFRPAPEDQGK